MNEVEIMNTGLINFSPDGRNKNAVIREMTEMLKSDGRISDTSAFYANVLEREGISSTDTGIGVAIPHGKGSFVERSSVVICRFDKGLVWDREPVKAVFLLAVDDDEDGLAHLELIAKVSTMLMDDDFLELLFTASSEKILFNEIKKRLEEEE
ncbi:MAG: PTS sugar transporter subunit IIA [Spirochaetales bacterium]|nr:PTS sugar transporter subunit IIA [Spirochaetales bacterium]